MRIRPIKNDKDHERALLRIEQMWGASPGTVKGDELDVLVTLVEAWDEQAYPIDVPNPTEGNQVSP